MPEPLESFISTMIPAVDLEMREVLKLDHLQGDPFYGMMHYHLGWVDKDLTLINANSGKRVRPLLCLLVSGANGIDWRVATPGGAALELIHNFTLIHDDIQDASPTRRGRPTVWNIWGANQAINSGDAMFALAHLAMSRLELHGVPSTTIVKAIRRLDEACVDLTIGQFMDMQFENETDVSIVDYLTMIDGKTAALLSLSAELGALIAGCPPESIDHYAAFGRDLGLAFQVRDDILGIWGDESVIGKSSATDIVTRKKSLPVLYGLAASDALRKLYDDSDGDEQFVQRAVDILDEVGAREYAETYEQDYAKSASAHLEAVMPQGKAGEALHQLAGVLLNRQM